MFHDPLWKSFIYQTANQMSIPADFDAWLVKQNAALINYTSSDNISPLIKFTNPLILL